MKKILGLAAGLFLTAMTFAQSGVTFSDASDSYDKATTTSFNFVFNSDYSVEDIDKAATYYTSYFTVATAANGADGNTVKIDLVEDNDMSRRVITRFFISLEVEQITVSGTDMTVDEFMSTYIMM